jgi:hypothetical protein
LQEDQIADLRSKGQVPDHAQIWDPRKQRWISAVEFAGAVSQPGPSAVPSDDIAVAQKNGKARVALILGILAFITIPLAWLVVLAIIPFLLGVAAVVVGVLARREINNSAGQQQGMGLTLAGLLLGLFALLLSIAVPALVVFLFGNAASTACQVVMRGNMQSAVIAQETVRETTGAYSDSEAVLRSEGLYTPINTGTCPQEPSLEILSADSDDYCMQISADSTVYSAQANTGVREGPCREKP